MDLTLIGYTASVFVTLLALSTYSHWGIAEVHAYTIPPYMEERGYTSKIVANQVVDSMRRIQIEVASLKETKVVVQGQAQPIGDVASYFGIVELLRATEDLMGLGPRVIELEITQNEETAHWRVRGEHVVHGFMIRQGDVPLADPDALIDYLGLQVVSYVSPFEALAFHFIHDSKSGSYQTTVSEASELLVDCQKIYSWACTQSNIKNAYLLRGMAHLYSNEVSRAFDDFDAANKIGTQSALGLAFYGDAFAALGQEAAAKRQYERARTLDGTIGQRFLALAEGYAKSENHRLAERRFATAAELGLNSDELLAAWGDTLFKLGSFDAALEKYRLAEAFDIETQLYADRIDRAQKALDEAKLPAQDKAPVADQPAPMGETKPVQPATPAATPTPAPTK